MSFYSAEDFAKDKKTVEAVAFDLLQIGELVHIGLSEEIKGRMKKVPWHEIYGLRNRIVHGYEGVKMNIVWEMIIFDIPKLKEQLEEELKTM